jgi:hypothetical protein
MGSPFSVRIFRYRWRRNRRNLMSKSSAETLKARLIGFSMLPPIWLRNSKRSSRTASLPHSAATKSKTACPKR